MTVKGKKIVPVPGETVIMRAYTFTNYAGRFLLRRGPQQGQHEQLRPDEALSYAGPDGTF